MPRCPQLPMSFQFVTSHLHLSFQTAESRHFLMMRNRINHKPFIKLFYHFYLERQSHHSKFSVKIVTIDTPNKLKKPADFFFSMLRYHDYRDSRWQKASRPCLRLALPQNLVSGAPQRYSRCWNSCCTYHPFWLD